MPLFHIHGLMVALLSSLGAGASIFCSPGFNALKFFAWMKEANPSWYTAVPTMHQAILARAARNREVIETGRLRLIRSSSASLPPQVMRELEETFDAPVIESYGMTEAAHQMTSNPLPPRQRKAGTVGVAAGPEVSIIDEDGNLLAPGSTGEVVIRGPNVTSGVAAALVLSEGSGLTENDIRDFARSRLADFKVPRRVVFLEAIPKGPTGKLQRIALAEKLGLG